MAARSARYLAPIALVATVVAVYIIVHGAIGTNHASAPAVTHSVVRRTSSTKATTPRPRYYVVRAGDTLSSIALKEGISVTALERLNPNVNPSALQTGQRLRLR
jgi:LysM repeat protein